MSFKILVVDDEAQMRKALEAVLERKGYEVVVAENGAEALLKIKAGAFDAMITDIKMPGMSGIELLRSVRAVNPSLPILMMTAYGTIENAIEAMKEGASDYILKPFPSEIIESAVARALGGAAKDTESGLKVKDEKMKELLEVAKNIAPTAATVLITGESGTGKELLARYIHSLSDRSEKPFVSVNCASIPEGLLESELFGHEKGAFTGALAKRIGKFEQADGGTLLLDEVGEMGLQLQAKLLRVLQEREIDRVGGSGPVKVDIRVIATTNKELKAEASAGGFREDLYYRLNVFPFTLLPLRERPDDIELLSRHFLDLFADRYAKPVTDIESTAMKSLMHNPWKGNVRELENVMERAVLMSSSGALTLDNLYYGEEVPVRSEMPEVANGTIREMEKELILKAIEDCDGNKTQAAKKLGISIRTLRNKLKEYSVEA
ncbi:MAG: sigma-54 dependent transcriptional regulator [Thermodesulfobacteriota bacterium]